MTVLLFVVGVLCAALGVGLSIALHEIGHLVPAKRFGVRVTQYMIGFGPTLWSRRRGETEYGIKAIPLGGYIRMIGMFPPRAGEDPGLIRESSTGRFTQLVDEARRASSFEVQPGDENRVFYKLSTPKKVAVMLGGPLMNLAIAVTVITGVVTLYGIQAPQDGATVAAVYECVVPAPSASSRDTCPAGAAKTPAYAGGLKPGDRLVSINGQAIRKTSDVTANIGPRSGQPTSVVVDRAGDTVELTITPVTNTLPVFDDDGEPVLDSAGKQTTHEVGFLGISSAPVLARERQSVTVVPGIVGSNVKLMAGVILNLPQRMVDVANAAFGSAERDPNGPQSVVGVGRIAGEVTSGKLDDLIGGSPWDKVMFLLSILASLNIALFVFNLVPLLPLDGGHVAGALWEGLKRQAARLLKRPDPGYVDVAKGLPIAYAVSMVLLVMSALLIYADIVKPIKLGG